MASFKPTQLPSEREHTLVCAVSVLIGVKCIVDTRRRIDLF